MLPSFVSLLLIRLERIFNMDSLSAQGQDDFICRFYWYCWDIIGQYIVLAVHKFFRTGCVFPRLNSNFIVLVSKTPTTLTVDQFQPIALGNFLF